VTAALERVLFFLVLWVLLSIALTAKALRAQVRGEPYIFGWLDGGLLLRGEAYSPWTILGAIALCWGLVGGILAWGADLTERLQPTPHGCRKLITAAELEEALGAPYDGRWPAGTPDWLSQDSEHQISCTSRHVRRGTERYAEVSPGAWRARKRRPAGARIGWPTTSSAGW